MSHQSQYENDRERAAVGSDEYVCPICGGDERDCDCFDFVDDGNDRNGGVPCEWNGGRLLTESPSPFTEPEDHGQSFVRKLFGGSSFANEGRKP